MYVRYFYILTVSEAYKFKQESGDAGRRFEQTDVEGFLAHHHDIIIYSAINESQRTSDIDVQIAQRRFVS